MFFEKKMTDHEFREEQMLFFGVFKHTYSCFSIERRKTRGLSRCGGEREKKIHDTENLAKSQKHFSFEPLAERWKNRETQTKKKSDTRERCNLAIFHVKIEVQKEFVPDLIYRGIFFPSDEADWNFGSKST